MSELSKFINMIIEYGEKLQSTLNKKYKPFIRSICNLESLAKKVDPKSIFLTNEIIIFKLGLEAKSTKSIEVSLVYLQKLLSCKFIELTTPNFAQEYEIEDLTVRKKENANIRHDMRYQLLRLLEPLIHFKSHDINHLLYRVYEHLITEPIAPILIELNLITPSDLGQKIVYNYFSYRFYIFQEIYTFTEAEFKSINPLSIRNERINQEIEAAFVNHENLLDLVHKYVGEIVAAVAGVGGKYGLCVICRQPADYFCKLTKASLCGSDCKKRHIELAEKQYKGYFQAVNLWREIEVNFTYLLEVLSHKESKYLLSVLCLLLEKPHVFMVVKRQFRSLISGSVSAIINCAFNYKDETSFEIIYSLVAALARYFMVESMSSLEYFFRESVLKVLEDKRPNYKMLMIVFKALAKIFEYGKTLIELYVNFDCEFNKLNVIERVMFEISRMCQDKFSGSLYFNKNEKQAIKNSCVTVFSIIAKGLNDYRAVYHELIPEQIEEILELKQKKTNLEKFVRKFNEHWSEGLKTLFNLNMVGLESEKEIVDIIVSTKGLKKEQIEEFLLSQNGKQYMDHFMTFFSRHGTELQALLELFKVVPLKKSTLLVKLLEERLLKNDLEGAEDKGTKVFKTKEIVEFLNSKYKLQDVKVFVEKMQLQTTEQFNDMYMDCLQTRSEVTLGTHKTYFRHCISQSYLEVFASQLSLLQIPILYMLETSYSQEKVFQIINNLIPICPHANWVQLCLKNVDSEKLVSGLSKEESRIVINSLNLCTEHAEFISEWSGTLQFLCKVYKAVSKEQSKPKDDGLQSDFLTIGEIEDFLLHLGQKCGHNFNRFIIALLKIAQEEQIVVRGKENVFFLQKAFEVIEQNPSKFYIHHSQVIAEIKTMTRSHKPTSAEYSIYLCDMLKQLFIKLLRYYDSTNSKKQNADLSISVEVKREVEKGFFEIFESLLSIKIQGNKEVNDLVMNNISVIIMHFYNFEAETWSFIIDRLVTPSLRCYRQQCLSILQKIIGEQLSCLDAELEWDLINIGLDLVDKTEVKISIQSMHALNEIITILLKKEAEESPKQTIREEEGYVNKSRAQGEEDGLEKGTSLEQRRKSSEIKGLEEKTKNKRYLLYILERLIEFISYDCHEGAIETLFMLLKTPSPLASLEERNAGKFLTDSEINSVMEKIFVKLEQLPQPLLSRGQKIMNESLFWSVRNKNHGIINNLEFSIVNKFTELSYTAMKCFKTYISMTNPKQSQDWKPIEETLIRVLNNTHLTDVKGLFFESRKENRQLLLRSIRGLRNQSAEGGAENSPQSSSEERKSSIGGQLEDFSILTFSNKLMVQRMAVEVLPNDLSVIDQLLRIYSQSVQFNDNLELRCLLWRKGLAANNTSSPPDILSLEELISYRIISTYYWSKQYEKIADFTLTILERYCDASKRWEELSSNPQSYAINFTKQDTLDYPHEIFELYMLESQYWNRRRAPLKVIINYMLPKIPKICRALNNRQRIIHSIIEAMKFCQERAPYVEAVRQLVMFK